MIGILKSRENFSVRQHFLLDVYLYFPPHQALMPAACYPAIEILSLSIIRFRIVLFFPYFLVLIKQSNKCMKKHLKVMIFHFLANQLL